MSGIDPTGALALTLSALIAEVLCELSGGSGAVALRPPRTASAPASGTPKTV